MLKATLNLIKVIKYLDTLSRFRLLLNLLLSLLSSIIEALSLSSALLFFTILFSGEISEIPLINNYFPLVLKLSTSNLIFIFVLLFSLSGLFRIYYLRNTYFLSSYITNKISTLAFSKLIHQNFSYHLKSNSSLKSSILTNDVGITVAAIYSLLNAISSTFSLIAISSTLFFIINNQTILFLICIPLIYFLFFISNVKKFRKNSSEISIYLGKQLNFVKDSLLSIRNIILSNEHEFYVKTFIKNNKKVLNSVAFNNFAASYPRTALEVIVIATISSLFIIYPSLSNPKYFPIFASTILGLQRLFPLFQLLYSSFSGIQTSNTGIINLLSLLELKYEDKHLYRNDKFKFKSLKLVDTFFSYPGSERIVINPFSIEFKAMDRVGISGPSGSGKTTFIDLMMFLLRPTRGTYFLNNQEINFLNYSNLYNQYQDSISYVAQNIYLIDSDIFTNIVGPYTKKVNHDNLQLALKVAALNSFINEKSCKINYKVGENGSLLSGGQRQRIGIAREIYKMNPILILDEATNALDKKTENNILRQIFSLQHIKLVIFITHNKNNLKLCNRKIIIDKGEIIEQT